MSHMWYLRRMEYLSSANSYLKYFFNAKNAHGIHSPFIFKLYNDAIKDKGSYYCYDRIEGLRAALSNNHSKINVTDLGTGNSGERIISEIVARSCVSKKYGQLLFRLVNFFKPAEIIELGTSLGIGTAYLASGNSNANVNTIEGCPEVSLIARKNLKRLNLKNVHIHTGDFSERLPDVLNVVKGKPILFYLDGNHQEEPTLRYFESCLQHTQDNGVFIFDDINWSGEMQNAWNKIKAHPDVSATIDLYKMGIAMTNRDLSKEHFTLRF